ncbi:MAG TPA: ribonuclease PH [bacterium]|nr:ribonuclease PH [Candidatus Omnitrophota bacterium]HOJ59393.1 ribonuclease PH [bacterium]HOL94138.1 ribonuclease PH [bacterium]HPP01165.1 ribonuclease PH [bacterium]
MKKTTWRRAEGRLDNQMRPIAFQRSYLDFAEGSCLVSFGRTKVICAASIDDQVPPFLIGSGQGWITAEYSMLPKSTRQRTPRDRAKSGRSHEIQRLIGRSLRGITDLTRLGERTIYIDCDVVQADGGTRSAAISGAALALHDALYFMKKNQIIQEWPLRELAAAVSVGLVEGRVCLDLDFSEDSMADVDFNVVKTESGKFIEIQGTAEHNTFDMDQLKQFLETAEEGIQRILQAQREALAAG